MGWAWNRPHDGRSDANISDPQRQFLCAVRTTGAFRWLPMLWICTVPFCGAPPAAQVVVAVDQASTLPADDKCARGHGSPPWQLLCYDSSSRVALRLHKNPSPGIMAGTRQWMAHLHSGLPTGEGPGLPRRCAGRHGRGGERCRLYHKCCRLVFLLVWERAACWVVLFD